MNKIMKTSFVVLSACLATAGMTTLANATGNYHVKEKLVCYDCHTMHASVTQGMEDGTVDGNDPYGDGRGIWASVNTGNPNHFLLKGASVNELCLKCHDGQTFAPDVMGADINNITNGRSAGQLNFEGGGVEYTGHSLDNTATPPGFNTDITAGTDSYTGDTDGVGLECTSCHIQHGMAGVYRNLGPRSVTGMTAAEVSLFKPSNQQALAQDTTVDVTILDDTYNTGDAGNDFSRYYAYGKMAFSKRTPEMLKNGHYGDNRLANFCSRCHSDFHGSPGDGNIDTLANGFIRHPTSGITVGANGTGGFSSASRYSANKNKVPTLTNNMGSNSYLTQNWGAAVDNEPFCMSCHKAHGSANPFNLFFLNRTTTAAPDSSGHTVANVTEGFRNLCGNCHGQGN